MSPRQSKTGSRSASRTRGGRTGGNTSRRGGTHSRSMSASQRASRNTSRAASSSRRGAQKSRGVASRAKRSRRAGSSAPYALKLLKQDHRAVAEALEEFESAGREEKQAIARRICRMLTVHSQIEEELLYPQAREALRSDDSHLVAEARVEHASLKDLIRQIEDREQVDEQFEAKVRVLGEYVEHHVGEEENELFPRLERSSLDLQSLGEQLEARKRELGGEETAGHDGGSMQDEEAAESGLSGGRSRGGRSHRSGALHARRAS